MQRRAFIWAGGTLIFGGSTAMAIWSKAATAESEQFEYVLSDEQWRARLSPEAYRVLRKEGTERAGSSPLNLEKRAGVFHCAGCDLALFDAATKYESGTGWPSFYQPIEGAIGTREDRSFFTTRTEVHCRRCGGHLGHVFPDGPPPTGMRYCMNGVAMQFVPAP